ncbi:MAG: hypothetical protein JNL60_04955 [Bacteroidia bacterium]|nr:hypothetical protein [Bacteroidia bacterium]
MLRPNISFSYGLMALFYFCIGFSKAQFYNLPNDYSFSLLTERGLNVPDSSIHSGIKPYIPFFSKKYLHVADSHKVFKFIVDDPAIDEVFYKHFLRVEPKKEKFKLYIDPILNLEVGKNLSDTVSKMLYSNTRGLIASGVIGDRVYFETMFAESQSVFPNYIADAARASQVVPGQGRWKTFKTSGFDYAFSSGFVSIQALKKLNIQVGHGKQKIGNGYRSLLLSDNSFNYPFARVTQSWFKGRVQYSNIYAVLMNLVPAAKIINPNTERLFQKKAASFQYLSVNVTKRFNLGFFQALIWQAGDDKNRQHLDWQYFNPVIYTNLASYGLHNKNNILIGCDAKVKLSRSFSLYGQFMGDNLSSRDSTDVTYGYQLGVNYFDAFGFKNLFMQIEFNDVKAGSYINPKGAVSDQSYSHYNQNLAYTPGNGQEMVVIGDYKKNRFSANARYHYQWVEMFGGTYSQISIINAKIGYLINPSYNLNISLGILYRTQNFSTFSSLDNQTNYIYVGLKTSIYNLYYDF